MVCAGVNLLNTVNSITLSAACILSATHCSHKGGRGRKGKRHTEGERETQREKGVESSETCWKLDKLYAADTLWGDCLLTPLNLVLKNSVCLFNSKKATEGFNLGQKTLSVMEMALPILWWLDMEDVRSPVSCFSFLPSSCFFEYTYPNAAQSKRNG